VCAPCLPRRARPQTFLGHPFRAPLLLVPGCPSRKEVDGPIDEHTRFSDTSDPTRDHQSRAGWSISGLLFSPDERRALAGFLAGYRGLTREAYALDLRQYVTWCTNHRVPLFCARRVDVEAFGRHLESMGRARATVTRRLCTIACFYRYAEEEGLIAVSPAVHVRRPRLDDESHATGLDRNEVGALLVCRGARQRQGSRSGQPAGPQRPATLAGDRCQHRSARPGAGPPDPDHPPQGWQDRHDPTGPTDGPGDGSGRR
jgi:hypothetical protein